MVRPSCLPPISSADRPGSWTRDTAPRQPPQGALLHRGAGSHQDVSPGLVQTVQGQLLVGAGSRENAGAGSCQQVFHWGREERKALAGLSRAGSGWGLPHPWPNSRPLPAGSWPLTLPLLLPAALQDLPWLPHQVSLVGVCSGQGTVPHRGDFRLEPGAHIDPSAGVERTGSEPSSCGDGEPDFLPGEWRRGGGWRVAEQGFSCVWGNPAS